MVFVGTLYPLALDVATGEKVTVGAPYFNATFGPIFALTAALVAIGAFLPWKRARLGALKGRLAAMALAAGLAVLLLAGLGFRAPLGLAGTALAVWVRSSRARRSMRFRSTATNWTNSTAILWPT